MIPGMTPTVEYIAILRSKVEELSEAARLAKENPLDCNTTHVGHYSVLCQNLCLIFGNLCQELMNDSFECVCYQCDRKRAAIVKAAIEVGKS